MYCICIESETQRRWFFNLASQVMITQIRGFKNFNHSFGIFFLQLLQFFTILITNFRQPYSKLKFKRTRIYKRRKYSPYTIVCVGNMLAVILTPAGATWAWIYPSGSLRTLRKWCPETKHREMFSRERHSAFVLVTVLLS